MTNHRREVVHMARRDVLPPPADAWAQLHCVYDTQRKAIEYELQGRTVEDGALLEACLPTGKSLCVRFEFDGRPEHRPVFYLVLYGPQSASMWIPETAYFRRAE
jgi:hypothetical protein